MTETEEERALWQEIATAAGKIESNLESVMMGMPARGRTNMSIHKHHEDMTSEAIKRSNGIALSAREVLVLRNILSKSACPK